MKPFQVSRFKFEVGTDCALESNFKLQTSNFKLGGLVLVLGGMMLVAPVVTWSQIATDPTKPAAGFYAGEPEAAGESGGMVLQSVMISSAGRAAIINGAVVKLGQKYGDAVLTRVAENEVVLKSGDIIHVLKMYPGVEKRDIAPPAAKAAPRRSKGRKGADPPAAAGAGPR
jgi:hypothetical protein